MNQKEKHQLKYRIWKGIVQRAVADGDNSLKDIDCPDAHVPIYKSVWFKYLSRCAVLVLFLFVAQLYFRHITDTSTDSSTGNDAMHRSTIISDAGDSIYFYSEVQEETELYRNGCAKLVLVDGNILKVLQTQEAVHLGKANNLLLKVGNGQQYKVVLSDGSLVNVNANSKLSFPLHFSTEDRAVTLDGEAYFEVVTDKLRPFLVETEDQRIRVYGTKFNVKNYADENQAITTLFEGKVSVQKTVQGKVSEEHILRPGERFVIVKSEQHVQAEEVKGDRETLAWTKGLFVYEDASLVTVLKDFSRWYGVDVDWTSVPDLRFEGAIPRHYSLAEALELIELTSDLKMEVTNNQITFKNER